MKMTSQQLAWITHHKKDAEWLWQVMEEGFEILALDGDRDSLDVSNLVLVYGRDGEKLRTGKKSKSEMCYFLRKSGKTWDEVALIVGVDRSNAWSLSKRYERRWVREAGVVGSA